MQEEHTPGVSAQVREYLLTSSRGATSSAHGQRGFREAETQAQGGNGTKTHGRAAWTERHLKEDLVTVAAATLKFLNYNVTSKALCSAEAVHK